MADEPNIEDGLDRDPETGFVLMQPDQAAAVFGAAGGGGVTVQQIGPNEEKRRRKDVKTSVCDQIELAGQKWHIPRHRVRIKPVFDGKTASVEVVDGLDEITRNFSQKLIDSLRTEGIDGVNLAEATIPHLFSLARHLLLIHYELSNDELSFLLSIEKGSTWPSEIVNWSIGYDPETDEDIPAGISQEDAEDIYNDMFKPLDEDVIGAPRKGVRGWLKSLRSKLMSKPR